jgi:hypothetical protein
MRLALTTARLDGRENVLGVLELDGQVDLLAALDQSETLWEVYEAIQEVDGWWGS